MSMFTDRLDGFLPRVIDSIYLRSPMSRLWMGAEVDQHALKTEYTAMGGTYVTLRQQIRPKLFYLRDSGIARLFFRTLREGFAPRVHFAKYLLRSLSHRFMGECAQIWPREGTIVANIDIPLDEQLWSALFVDIRPVKRALAAGLWHAFDSEAERS